MFVSHRWTEWVKKRLITQNLLPRIQDNKVFAIKHHVTKQQNCEIHPQKGVQWNAILPDQQLKWKSIYYLDHAHKTNKQFYIITSGFNLLHLWDTASHPVVYYLFKRGLKGHQQLVHPPSSAHCNLQAARPRLQMPFTAQRNWVGSR